uniref:ZP domain-containing protein n=1 Tax=Paramormyrops kingsleyae TaxID=1676925 RepID=A0A3B3R544_9TELE
MLRGMREFLMLVVFLAFCFNVCALNLSPYVYALFSDDDSVSRNHSDDWKNFMMMQSDQQGFARESDRQGFAREIRWSPLNLPVSMPAVGSMVLPIDVFKPALGSRLLPDMVKNILRPPPLPTPTTQKMVEVQCRAGRIVVRVLRELFGLPNAQQDLSLGTCQVNKVTPLHFYFDYSLGSCKTMRKSFNDRMEYSNTLSYAPAFSGPVVRVFQLLQDDWMKNDVYLLGQPMNFEVKVPQKTRNERVYVNKCYVTKSANPTSTPRFAVIDNYGCMLDSVKNPQSKFVPDARQNKIRFKIWAFVFPETRTQVTQVSYVKPFCYFASACKFSCKGRSLFEVGEIFDTSNDACSCCSSKCPAGLKTSEYMVDRIVSTSVFEP